MRIFLFRWVFSAALLLFFLTGCKKRDALSAAALLAPANWQLTGYRANADSSTESWINVSTANSKVLAFHADGRIGGDFSIDMKGFEIIEHNKIRISFTHGADRIYRYLLSEDGSQLQLLGPCTEPCGSKFLRIGNANE